MSPKTLYLHSHGQPVRALQLLLKNYDGSLTVDGKFGPLTERAVRAAQRKLGVFPADGLAGPHTLDALTKAAKPASTVSPLSRPAPPRPPSLSSQAGTLARKAGAAVESAEHSVVNTVEEAIAAIEKFITGLRTPAHPVPATIQPVVQPSKAKAQREPQPPGQVRDPKTMQTSQAGSDFVFWWEARDGKATSVIHLPSKGSGVTLGPGYDMGGRNPAEIKRTMLAIGVAPDAADTISQAAGKWGTLKAGETISAAKAFVQAHKDVVHLTVKQQKQLESIYQGPLGDKVRRDIHVPLHQHEFDALVSFSGNSGKNSTGWNTTARMMNEHKHAEAAAEIMLYVHSGPEVLDGLLARREAETALLLYGDYTWARHRQHRVKTSEADKE